MDTNNSNPLYIDSSAFLKKLSIELIGLKPINIGNIVAPVYQNECAIAIGPYAGYYEQGECAIAIGKQAGQTNQATQAIAIGVDAGQLEQGAYALAFGLGAGNDNQGTAAIAMGVGAGEFEQDEEAIAIGSSAGRSKQSTQAIAIGSSAGQNVQGQYAVALGYQAGLTGQGLHAIAIGNQAGKTAQPSNSIVLNATGGVLSSVTKSTALYVAPVSTGTTSNVLYYNSSSKEIVYGAAASGVPNGTNYSDYLFWDNNSSSWKVGQKEIHLGSEAGLTGQSSFAVALGHLAGRNTQNQGAIAIGYQAGQYSQGTFAIGIGYGAARSNQSVNAIAMGLQAGENDQNSGSIAIGYLVGQYSQGTFAIGIGYGAARSNQSVNAIAFGTTAGSNTQGSAAIALGFQSGQYAQNQDAIALGNSAGRTGQSANAIAIGTTAGISTQGFGAISVGYQSGQNSQGQNAIAIGNSAGRFLQSVNAIAIGTTAGANTQGSAAIALGFQAGQNSEGQNSIAIGNSAGRSSQFANTIAIGTTAGFSTQGTGAIALGFQAGQNAEGENAIAIGNSAGLNTQGSGAIAIGFAAGQISQSTNAIAIGVQAGQSIEAQNSVSIGTQAGQTQQSSGSIALGVQAGQNRQGVNAIAVGVQAGMTGQASGSLALGFQAGMTGQGTNAIAIGNQAGKTAQPSNSIVFNATGTALSSVTKSSAWYVSPISNGTTSNVLYYDSSSAEILYGTAPSGGGGSGQFYYFNANSNLQGVYSNQTQTVSTQGLVPAPTFPTEPSTPTFSGTLYSVSTEAAFDAAVTAAADGDIIEIPAATTITFTTTKTINKSLEIRGVSQTTSAILATFAIAANFGLINISGTKSDNVTPNNNVYIHDLTITVNNNTNDCSVINASTVSTNNTTGSTGLRFTNLILTTTEVSITLSASEWVVKNCSMSYTPPAGAGDTQRHLQIYNIGTKGWIEGCTFNATTNDYPTGRTLCIFLGSVDYGVSNSTGFAGDLVLKNNTQSVGFLRQFYLQETFKSNGPKADPMPTNAFSVWAEGNTFGVSSSGAFIFYAGAGLSPLNFFNTLYFVNNTELQTFGTQKGLLAIDGLGSVRSPGAPAQFVVSNNLIGDIFPSSFNGAYQSGSTIPNILGVNSTYFTIPSITLQAPASSSFPMISREYLSLGYIPVSTWTVTLYASSTDSSGNTYFSFNVGHTDSAGNNFTSLYSSGNFAVTVNAQTTFTTSFNVGYTNLSSTTRRLKFILNSTQTNGNTLTFYFNNTSGISTSVVDNIIPKSVLTGSVAIASLAASTATAQSVLFSYPFYSFPVVTSIINTTGSTNGNYVIASVANGSLGAITLNARNMHTSASATAFTINYMATPL